ncbi:MAG TPA: YceI family protein [Dokdonella sp.]|uniref:YceI family protein n=1 Tax=Dokdonella sp. TaxID=2291710 RepID=UPI002B5767F9|nr:YceI family protein [Dokdonella sp.]HOX72789.1 YceI family protein [Dokdonella sp.]
MKILSWIFVLSAVCGNALATDYVVGKGSTLGFSGTFQGEAFSGSFARFEARISYDPAQVESSNFDVTVDLASVTTGDSDRDAALPGSAFFNIGKFPSAQFVTRQFRKSGDEVIAEGTLSLKGISKPVDLTVKFAPNGAGAVLDVSTHVDRLDFDVGNGEYADTSTIANEVQIRAHLELGAKP